MEINLKEEYPEANLSNIETLKQIVSNKFQENDLPLYKIRKTINGLYVYGKYGSKHIRTERKFVRKISDSEHLYQRTKKIYNCDFISTENLEEFEDFLRMTLVENKRRKGA